jgi:predicted GIY-YIG superfamily endonuclease
MARNYVLYELAFTDGTFYIGISCRWKGRLKEHRTKWSEPFTHRFLLVNLARSEALSAEIKWIAYYPTIGKQLRNKAEGGRSSRPILESTRKRMGDSRRGKKASIETRKRMSIAQAGLKKSYTPLSRAASNAGAEKARRKFLDRWESMTKEERRQFKEERKTQQSLDALAEGRKKRWDKTPAERSVIGQKILARRLESHTTEELSEIGRRNASTAVLRDPQEFAKRMSNQVGGWWARLTVEERADFIARRQPAINAAKARKKAEREALRTSATMDA